MKSKHQVPTQSLFNDISRYWTEIAQADNTQKQLNYVKNNVKAEGWVLDLGCGSGRHTIALSVSGYTVVGLDVSSNLLEIAKSKAFEAGMRVPWVRADMRFLPFASEVFVAVLSLDASFGYLPSEEEDTQSLKEAARTLRAEGFLLLDVFNRPRLLRRYGKRFRFNLSFLYKQLPKFPQLAVLFKWKEYSSFHLLQKRSITCGGEKLRDLWVFRNKKTKKIIVRYHIARLYELSQLEVLLSGTDLQAVRVDGNYEGQQYNEDAKRLIIIAQRN
ncbi:MAG: class I SAM-dependent methyltransferase [Candidatus Bathyarchaeota archaeon]|nr:class I SAM-dependent methyltransferase [Candidatus Bathyarchaeota archaeon]